MELYANVFGEGTPFLILHGFLGMGDNWKTLGKKIAEQGYQVHLIDQRNHGRSPKADEFNYELLAEDLWAYCTTHDLQNIVLLGHSMGGKTAMLFASRYEHIIKKLIIVDIGPKYYPLHHQDILDGLQSLDFEELKTRGQVDQALSEYVKDTGVRMFLMKNLYWREKGQLDLRIHLSALVANADQIGVPLLNDSIFEGETLFLKGANSNYILEDDESLIKKHFLNAVIEEVSGAGHWLHAENPSEFLEIVFRFLKL